MILLILFSLYLNGVHFDVLIIIGLLFFTLILLRGKVWKFAEHILETYLPFTKKLPDWAEKVLLVLIFILFYLILKNVLYFILGLVGINLEEIIMSSFNFEN